MRSNWPAILRACFSLLSVMMTKCGLRTSTHCGALEAVAGMAVSRRSRAVEKMRMEVLVRINHGAHGRRSCGVKGPRVTSRRLRFEWLLVTLLMLIVRYGLLVCMER